MLSFLLTSSSLKKLAINFSCLQKLMQICMYAGTPSETCIPAGCKLSDLQTPDGVAYDFSRHNDCAPAFARR